MGRDRISEGPRRTLQKIAKRLPQLADRAGIWLHSWTVCLFFMALCTLRRCVAGRTAPLCNWCLRPPCSNLFLIAAVGSRSLALSCLQLFSVSPTCRTARTSYWAVEAPVWTRFTIGY